MRRVVLVTGPPCAGKTTHVRQHAQPGDLILDQDAIGKTAMNRELAQLPHHDGTAWVIRCAPGPRARRHLAQQIGATEQVHLVQPEPTLVHRAARRPNPRRHIAAVAQWFVRERADPAPRVSQASRTRGSTTDRGYGWTHQQARTHAIEDMPDGQPCTRCGQPMYRNQAALLDLDHNGPRTGYRGLAHRACNRRAGQAVGAQARRARGAARSAPVTTQQPQPRSRNW